MSYPAKFLGSKVINKYLEGHVVLSVSKYLFIGIFFLFHFTIFNDIFYFFYDILFRVYLKLVIIVDSKGQPHDILPSYVERRR